MVLKNRGFIDDIDTVYYQKCNNHELFKMLNSNKAYDRTSAIRILSKRVPIDDLSLVLLDLLTKETALYTKLELSDALAKGTPKTCRMMIPYLGIIGSNQYKSIPDKVSKKISYPLPRDIIARTISRMSVDCFDVMLEVLDSGDLTKISEGLDAIGFMAFYNKELKHLEHFNQIKDVTMKYRDNKLILWKCITCFSAFPLEESKQYLQLLKASESHSTILLEIERSLKLISER